MKNIIIDVMILGGLALISIGVSMIYKPAGFIFAGLALATTAIFAART